MRIYRLTYEEIDTENKYNSETNKRVTCQQTVSDYELDNPLYKEEFIKTIKKNIIDKVVSSVL